MHRDQLERIDASAFASFAFTGSEEPFGFEPAFRDAQGALPTNENPDEHYAAGHRPTQAHCVAAHLPGVLPPAPVLEAPANPTTLPYLLARGGPMSGAPIRSERWWALAQARHHA